MLRVDIQIILRKRLGSLCTISVFTCLIGGSIIYVNFFKNKIVEIMSIKEAEPYFRRADQKTLVIFDVDSTLITPSDPYLQRQAIKRHNSIYKACVNSLTKNQLRIFRHLLNINSTSCLVEDILPTCIKKLQERGIKTIAYTASKTGALGNIMASFPDWRYQDLKRFGIDFSDAFPGKILFKESSDFGGDYPGIEKGIVYSGQKYQKGEILPLVLSALNFMPKTLIMIDDRIDNIESFKEAVTQYFPKIRFIGVYYRAIEKLPQTQTVETIFKKKILNLISQTQTICAA